MDIIRYVQAYHINAFNYILYYISINWSLFLLVIAASITAILSFSLESETTIDDSQTMI